MEQVCMLLEVRGAAERRTVARRESRRSRHAQGHDDLIVLFNQFLPEGHDMRVVLENAKQRPRFSQGMEVLVLALAASGVLEYVPGVVTSTAPNGTFTIIRHDGRFERDVTPSRMKLEHLQLGGAPAQMAAGDSPQQHVRAALPSCCE